MRKLIFISICVFVAVSCEEIINEPNISNDRVVALAPTNTTSLNEKEQINFNWQSVAGSNSYELQIATPSFSQAAQVQLDTVIENVLFSVDSLKLGNYEWRVRAPLPHDCIPRCRTIVSCGWDPAAARLYRVVGIA